MAPPPPSRSFSLRSLFALVTLIAAGMGAMRLIGFVDFVTMTAPIECILLAAVLQFYLRFAPGWSVALSSALTISVNTSAILLISYLQLGPPLTAHTDFFERKQFLSALPTTSFLVTLFFTAELTPFSLLALYFANHADLCRASADESTLILPSLKASRRDWEL